MEFGALWCKPQNPKCEDCPLQAQCLAFQNKTVALLPVKDKKIKIRNRYFHYFVFNYKDNVYIQKRTEKDIWQNLYEFYLIETDLPTDAKLILKNKNLKTLVKKMDVISIISTKKHVLSHQHIYATFYEINLSNPIESVILTKIKREKLSDFGLPQLINKYLKSSV
jgi:A/G-specific adenine glycosylase